MTLFRNPYGNDRPSLPPCVVICISVIVMAYVLGRLYGSNAAFIDPQSQAVLYPINWEHISDIDTSYTSECIRNTSTGQHWRLKSLGADFGAEVHGIGYNCIDSFSSDEIKRLKSLLLSNKVLLLRFPLYMSFLEQISFSKRFLNNDGLLDIHIESQSQAPGYPEVTIISNVLDRTNKLVGLNGSNVENFHSDLSWSRSPAVITFLYSVLQPLDCGDTVFVNTETAYDTLPETVKARLNSSVGLYCYLKTLVNAERLSDHEKLIARNCASHPIFTQHPISKKMSIFANPTDLTTIIGLSEIESDFYIDYLARHVSGHPDSYTHKYSPGDLVIFDNRGLQHRGTGCATRQPRVLHRTIAV